MKGIIGKYRMPIQSGWLIRGRNIYVTCHGDISAYATRVIVQRNLERISNYDKVPNTHIICHFENITLTDKVLQYRNAAKSVFKHQQLGYFILVNPDRHVILESFTNIVTQIFRINYSSFETLDDALEFLNKVDTTLPDLNLEMIPSSHDLELNYPVAKK